MKKRALVRGTALCVLVFSIQACATAPEPFEYAPDNELKKGRGLFSGDDGVFTIYKKPSPNDDGSQDRDDPE